MHHPQPPHEEKDERLYEELGSFFSCTGSKFKANHREADFYLHTFLLSNCVMRPFSKWCWPQFKASAVQRKSDFIFAQRSLNAITPKSSGLAPHPFQMLERPGLRIPKDTFQSIKKDFTPLVLWQAPISLFAGSGRVWEQNLFKVLIALSAHLLPWTGSHGSHFELPPAESHF